MQKILLVIEDDPYVQRFYGRLFRLHSYQVELASNGTEGLAMAKKLNPGLILLDLMMPGMNGIEVLEKLKADSSTKDLMVVILTNYGEEEVRMKTKQLGASDFIVKSQASPDDLLAVVQQYLG